MQENEEHIYSKIYLEEIMGKALKSVTIISLIFQGIEV